MINYTIAYLQLYEYLYNHGIFVKRAFILKYTYIYTSGYIYVQC